VERAKLVERIVRQQRLATSPAAILGNSRVMRRLAFAATQLDKE